MDEKDEIGAEQQSTAPTHPTYSVYEPHYQQMHPLIYYEDNNGSHSHPHILGTAVAHHWDQEHFVHMPMIPFGDTSTRACLHGVGYNQPTASSSPSSTSTALGPSTTSAETTSASAPIVTTTTPKIEPTATSTMPSLPNSQSAGGGGGEFRQNQLTPTNREMHNEIERKRRLRIKQCCDVLRTLVPGLTDKTDKATVLEHTVKFVSHLSKCSNLNCNCEH